MVDHITLNLPIQFQYKMERLKKYCEKYFYKNLTLENALETLDLAVETVSDELQDECYEFLLK